MVNDMGKCLRHMLIEKNEQQNYIYNMNSIYTQTHKASTAECWLWFSLGGGVLSNFKIFQRLFYIFIILYNEFVTEL